MKLEVSELVDVDLDGVVLRIPLSEITTLARQVLVNYQPHTEVGDLVNDVNVNGYRRILNSAGKLIAEERKYHLQNLGEWPNNKGV